MEEFKKELIESGVRADFIRSENFDNFIKQPGIEEIWRMENFEEAAKEISQNIKIKVEKDSGKIRIEIDESKLSEAAKKLLNILKEILPCEGEREQTESIKVFDYISYFLPQKDLNLKELASIVETVIISLKKPYTLYKPEFTEDGGEIKDARGKTIKDARGKTEIAIPATLAIFNEMGVKMTGIFAEPSEARRVFEILRERGGREGKIGELETISLNIDGKEVEFVLFINEKAREEKVLNIDAMQLKDKIILTDIHTLQHIEMERIRGDKRARELSSEIYKRGIVVDEIHQVSQAPFLIIGFNGRSLKEYFGDRRYEEFVKDVETVEKVFGELLEGDWNKGEELFEREENGKTHRYIKKESLEPTKELWEIFAERFGIGNKDFVSSEKYEDKRALIKAFARNLFMKEEYEGGFGFKYRYDKEKGKGYYIVCPVHLFQIREDMRWQSPEEAASRWVIAYRMKGIRKDGKPEPVEDILSRVEVSEDSLKTSPVTVLKNFNSFKIFYSATPFYAEVFSKFLGVEYKGEKFDTFRERAKETIENIKKERRYKEGNYEDLLSLDKDEANIILPCFETHLEVLLSKVISEASGKKVYFIEADGSISEVKVKNGEVKRDILTEKDTGGKEPKKWLEEKINKGDKNIVVVFSPAKLTSYTFDIKRNANAEYILIVDGKTTLSDFWQAMRRNRAVSYTHLTLPTN